LQPAERFAITMLNKFAEWGVRIKLGKGKQVAVQTVPVLARAMSLLGRNSFDLINVIGDRIKDEEFQETIDNLFDNYPISQRGYLKQEFNNVNKEIPRSTKQRWRSELLSSVQKGDDVIKKLQMMPIEAADVMPLK